jgi:DNA modification methylase
VRRVLSPTGACFLNLGDGYAKNKNLMLLPARVAIALQADGWWIRSQLPWVKRATMPESASDRPGNAVEYIYMLTAGPSCVWDAEAVRRVGTIPAGTQGAQGGKERYAEGKLGKLVNGRPPEAWTYTGTRHFRNSDLFYDSLKGPMGLISDAAGEPIALDVNPVPGKRSHRAAFPPKLIEPLIRAACLPGDVVLDPFGGSGTVGLVCDRLQRDALLIDLNGDYAAMSAERVTEDMPPLFAEPAQIEMFEVPVT